MNHDAILAILTVLHTVAYLPAMKTTDTWEKRQIARNFKIILSKQI